MWKAPYRPAENQITQVYDDGIVKIYSVSDEAQPGKMPVPKLDPQPLFTLRYQEQRLGITRYYNALQNQIQIERVVRVQRAGTVTNQNVAITEDGKQYAINMVQSVTDVYPQSLDLTLSKIEQEYDVSQ